MSQRRKDMSKVGNWLFERNRIEALQEERLHIQQKTFTRWMNFFLKKVTLRL